VNPLNLLLKDKNISPEFKRGILYNRELMPLQKKKDILADLIQDGYDLSEIREALTPVKQKIKK
jgi:hypothetical protein